MQSKKLRVEVTRQAAVGMVLASTVNVAFMQASGQQTIRFTEGSDKTVADSDPSDVGVEAVEAKARATTEETKGAAVTRPLRRRRKEEEADAIEQAEVAAAVTELEQAELAVAAAVMAVSSTDKQGGDEPESGDDSSDEDKELEEEQEMDEEEYTKLKNARKGNIDGAEAEQSKAARKSSHPKRGAADGGGSQGK